MLRFDGKQQNSVYQLSFNKKNKLKKKLLYIPGNLKKTHVYNKGKTHA